MRNLSLILLAMALMLLPPATYAQLDSLIISVNNVALDGETELRGLNADFPFPILTTLSVMDTHFNVITGLADTLKWLGKDDIAENGRPISEIWQPLLEYHFENNALPTEPDIYQQLASPMFTEVRRSFSLPTSTMLVMDVSTSMEHEIENAKEGAQIYIRLFRDVDRGGIVQFSGRINRYQPVTSDTSVLMQVIDETQMQQGTDIYSALLESIDSIRSERGRRAIIVYTDGRNNNDDHTPEEVIENALRYNVPIFTIALGNNTQESVLREMAAQTGGLFFKAATAEEMKAIYVKLANLMQNYYVMAHTSTDPHYNGTLRVIDVTANLPEGTGAGKGYYYVPGPPQPPYSDLALSLSSRTDTTVWIDNVAIPIVQPGETFEYRLRIRNRGDHALDSVRVYQVLPDTVRFLSAFPPPHTQKDQLLSWSIAPAPEPGQFVDIRVSVELPAAIPDPLNWLYCQAKIFADEDTLWQNNFADDSLHVMTLEELPTTNYDLSLQQLVRTDTTIDLGAGPVPAVAEGDRYQYVLTVRNSGPAIARNFEIWNLIPDSVRITDFSRPPTVTNQDTLVWQIDSLLSQDTLSLAFTATTADSLPVIPFPLENVCQVDAEQDTFPENNRTRSLVYALRPEMPPADLRVTYTSITDTSIMLDGRSRNAVEPGDLYQYRITIENCGQGRADRVSLTQVLPDSVRLLSIQLPPGFTSTGPFTWATAALSPGETVELVENVQVATVMPLRSNDLVSQVNVQAINDTNLINNSASDTIRVLVAEPPPIRHYDLALQQEVTTDTLIEIGGQMFPAVWAGNAIEYRLLVTNRGPQPAFDFEVHDLLPDAVTVATAGMASVNQIGDTLFWQIDTLQAGQEKELVFPAIVADSLGDLPRHQENIAWVVAALDTFPANDSTRTTVYALPRQIPVKKWVDVEIDYTSFTDSTVWSDGRQINAVRAGEPFQYRLTIRNQGPIRADSVRLTQVLPDSVSLLSAELPEGVVEEQPFQWMVAALDSGQAIEWVENVRLAAQIDTARTELASWVRISLENDINPLNNLAADTVRIIRKESPLPITYNLGLRQTVTTDTLIRLDETEHPAIYAGGTAAYHLTLRNHGPDGARDFYVWKLLPDSVTVQNISIPIHSQNGDTLFWHFDSLAQDDSVRILVQVDVAETLPHTPFPLVDVNGIRAENDSRPDDNQASNLIYVIDRPLPPIEWAPAITAEPAIVETGTTIQVNVRVPVPVESWDLWVHRPTQPVDSSYADDYIAETDLTPNVWHPLQPSYLVNNKFTADPEEPVEFEFRATDPQQVTKSARATVLVLGGDDFQIDRNVFKPGRGDNCQFRFRTKQDGHVRLDLFDITGTFISNLFDAAVEAGWHTYEWNGQAGNGQKIGSGFYIVTYRTNEFYRWKKLMLVR